MIKTLYPAVFKASFIPCSSFTYKCLEGIVLIKNDHPFVVETHQGGFAEKNITLTNWSKMKRIILS